jgi:ribosomal protein S18 acetylase RimI-like enzyme
MGISTSISRLADYYRRHGFGATIRRTALAIRRALFSSRAVVFYCDLSRLTPPSADFPKSLKIEPKKSCAELNQQDLSQIISVWNAKLAQRNMEERFGKGALLWLIKFQDRLAGYGWTLQGRTIAQYYFPLAEDDVQFFDFHVFPKYRGRAIDWFLMTYVLQRLAVEGAARAFAEAGEWNQASLSSIAATPFRRLGSVRHVTILGCTVIYWSRESAVEEKPNSRQKNQSLATSRV